MAMDIRYYVVCQPTEKLRDAYFGDEQNAKEEVQKYLAGFISGEPIASDLGVAGLPSRNIKTDFGDKDDIPDPEPTALVVALRLSERTLEAVHAAAHTNTAVFQGGGADVPVSAAEHWCPREALDPIFADRGAAERLVGVDYLRAQGLTGQGVNVVIVDQGLDATRIHNELGGTFGGGWDVGTVQHGRVGSKHGMMIARNILKAAPGATIFDLPLLPERIAHIPTFLSTAQAAYTIMLEGIAALKKDDPQADAWVIVNAWALFDRRTDLLPPYDYSNGAKHAFNQLIECAVRKGNDVIFCAGNCGQFCPDDRCGPADRGPGRSILGGNSHSDVLTLGAVRADELWLGYSSQGPGQSNLARRKPDICGPSQFCEDDDANMTNTGTSAASAIAAGVVAALRERWRPGAVAPRRLIRVLKDTARRPAGAMWNERFGYGILDAKAAFERLQALL